MPDEDPQARDRALDAVRVPERARSAFRRLLAVLARLDSPVPCVSDPDAWTGEDAHLRAAAAVYCLHCPALAACAAYADAAGERHGTWGGRDRSRRTVPVPRPPTGGRNHEAR